MIDAGNNHQIYHFQINNSHYCPRYNNNNSYSNTYNSESPQSSTYQNRDYPKNQGNFREFRNLLTRGRSRKPLNFQNSQQFIECLGKMTERKRQHSE